MIDSDGCQANGGSDLPAISGDGQYVAFESWATNLVSGDTPTTQDIFIARVVFPTTPPPGGSLCAISDVPYLSQNDPRWGSLQYDNSSRTIDQWGCTLTSAAMIINYHGRSVGFSTTPSELNDYLKSLPDGQGYFGFGVNPRGPEKFARANGVTLYYNGRIDRRDDDTLRSYICSNNPVTLALQLDADKELDHFVVATGETIRNGTSTWTINDPEGISQDLSTYPGNIYAGIRLYSRNQASPFLFIATDPTVPFIVTDTVGRRTGFDQVTGETFAEIPGATYTAESYTDLDTGEASPTQYSFELFHPPSGTYTVQLSTSVATDYTAYFVGYDDADNPSSTTDTRQLSANSTQAYLVQYSSDVGQEIEVELVVDIDIKPDDDEDDDDDNANNGIATINLGSRGTTPVAIFSTATFDATTVNPTTVTLAGAPVTTRGRRGRLMASFEDVNRDGLRDMVVHFQTQALQLTPTDTEVALEGETFAGVRIRGVDAVRVVPPRAPRLDEADYPTFEWDRVSGAICYQIQIDNNADFSSPIQDATVDGRRYNADALPNGQYFWRVRVGGVCTNVIVSEWSEIGIFTVPPDDDDD